MNEIGSYKYNVIIIDDLPENIEVLGKILETKNIAISFALSAQTALTSIRKRLPDLILLDVTMPEIDGFELCKIIKADEKLCNIPVIFLTARTEPEAIIKGFELGAVDYVTKPFNSLELLSRVSTHLKLKKTEEDLKKHRDHLNELVIDRTNTLLETNNRLISEIEERKKIEAELRLSEKHYRSLIENSPDGITICDLKASIKELNVNQLMFLGYLDKKEVEGKGFFEFLYGVDKQDFIKNFELSLFAGENKKDTYFNFRIVQKNGEIRYHEARFMPVSDSTGLIYEIIIFTRDITERKYLQQKIVSTIIQTEEKERNRISKDLHDGLGALLSSINLYLDMVNNSELKEDEYKNTLNLMQQLLEQAINTTKEVANNLRPAVLSKFGLLNSITALIDSVTKASKLRIHLDTRQLALKLSDELEIAVFRIFYELLNNTIKYASANNVVIVLRNDKNYFYFNYSDDGTGFDLNLALNKKNSMGLKNIISRIDAIGGKINIITETGKCFETKIQIEI